MSQEKNNTKKIIFIISIILTLILTIIFIKTLYVKNNKIDNNVEIKTQQNQQDKIKQKVITEQNNDISQKQNNSASKIIENKDNRIDLLAISDDDIVLGKHDAKVTMIEYASLSCPHCAYFIRDAFPKLNQEYIKTGKVKFIYRDFPLDKTALSASLIAKCHALNNPEKKVDEYYKLIKLFFNSQDSWAGHSDYIKKLQIIAKIQGVEEETFQKCLNNNEIQDQILLRRIEAAKNLKISSTPTFFINGNMISGFTDFNKIKNIIENELKNNQ